MYNIISKSIRYRTLTEFPPIKPVSRVYCIQSGKYSEKPKKVVALKKYWFERYVDYIKNYDKVLEKNFPKTVQVYRVFSLGTKELFTDLKKYMAIVKKQGMQGTESLKCQELQLAYTMPKDLMKISPILILSAVPFTNYIILPMAYFFPQHVLTSHYWTLQQRTDFAILTHKKRLKHNRPLFRCVQARLETIQNQKLKTKWSGVIACLGSGTHPFTTEIIACEKLFADSPYSIKSLKRKHVKELLGIHGLAVWKPFRRWRLREHGMIIKQMDDAIQKEGGVTQMSADEIRWALYFRGLNPNNMSLEDMQDFLKNWLLVSQAVDINNISLLLHAPLLLAYNHPTNWVLIYS